MGDIWEIRPLWPLAWLQSNWDWKWDQFLGSGVVVGGWEGLGGEEPAWMRRVSLRLGGDVRRLIDVPSVVVSGMVWFWESASREAREGEKYELTGERALNLGWSGRGWYWFRTGRLGRPRSVWMPWRSKKVWRLA